MSQKMSRRCCILCGKSRSMYLLRYASKRKQQTAIVMQAYMEANSPPLEKIKTAFKECLQKNKRLCHVHYAEAGRKLATQLDRMGVQFLHYKDPTASGSTAYLNEGDIPPILIATINEAVQVIDEKLKMTSRDVCHFMNRCLQQYFCQYNHYFGKELQPASLAKLSAEELPFATEDSVTAEVESPPDLHEREIDITMLLAPFLDAAKKDANESSYCLEEAGSSVVGMTLSELLQKHSTASLEQDSLFASVKMEPNERCSNEESLHQEEAGPANGNHLFTSDRQESYEKVELNTETSTEGAVVLEETDPMLTKQIFVVDGQSLLELFRFCPNCGSELREKGGVQLTADGSTPVVRYSCKLCSRKIVSSYAPLLWKGRRIDETFIKQEVQEIDS